MAKIAETFTFGVFHSDVVQAFRPANRPPRSLRSPRFLLFVCRYFGSTIIASTSTGTKQATGAMCFDVCNIEQPFRFARAMVPGDWI